MTTSGTLYSSSSTVNDFLVTMVNPAPVVSGNGTAVSYNPWAIWVTGSYFTRASRAVLRDKDGTPWGAEIPVAFGSASNVSFQLPANMPPSRCNYGSPCTLQMTIANEYGPSAPANLRLPAIYDSSNGRPPSIGRFGLSFGYEPWVVWLEGSYFTPKSTVILTDATGSQWGSPLERVFVNESGLNFQLPADIPPSQCNKGRACDIWMQVKNEYGISAKTSLTLPALYNPAPPPSISRLGLSFGYEPWVVWVAGSYFTPKSTVILTDATGSQWGSPLERVFVNESGLNFQLPADIPPSKCNKGRACDIWMQVKSEYGLSAATKLTLPALYDTAPPPSILRFGLVQTFNPWVIWVQGTYFTPKATVTLFDSDGKQWGDPIKQGFISESNVNFQLPANIPPSQCNKGRACTIRFRISTEFGNSPDAQLELLSVP